MTAKTLRNERRIDFTRGVSREQRAINRRNNVEWADAETRSILKLLRKQEAIEMAVANYDKNLCAFERRWSEGLYDGEVLAFVEKPFGSPVKPGEPCLTSDDVDIAFLPSIVVSLALFDGDKMIFACSGIPLPHGKEELVLTRFVTSAHLVRVFNNYRNKDDKFRVVVRLPNDKTTDGFLGLYDNDIAIVTCLGRLDVCPIDLNLKEKPAAPRCPGDKVLAAGRAFMSSSLMTMHGSPCEVCNSTWIPDDQQMFKAVLGGPLIQKDARFIGLIYDFYDHRDAIVRYSFLSLELLYKRLEHFGILNPKQLHFRGYELPQGVKSILPSGFLKTINRIRYYGYPVPPPLVLEFNGRLLNKFEERFGDILTWKGYPYGYPCSPSKERVWGRLPKQVVTDISRRVVSLASFDGAVRSFACTGLLIKWHGSKTMRTVILTSASLVRSRDNKEDNIDENLRIEVFLPPNQRGSGTLELYNLKYNIAIISVKKNFIAIHAEDIFSGTLEKPSEKVVSIGRDAIYGPLMASTGEVKHSNKGSKVKCKDVLVSTCKIKKAGIGGPLINFDGNFVGLNFYDGSEVTPFLPKDKIAEVLRGAIEFPLPSEIPLESGHHPVRIGVCEDTEENGWPVPKPYWYHGALDVYRYHMPMLHGRRLD